MVEAAGILPHVVLRDRGRMCRDDREEARKVPDEWPTAGVVVATRDRPLLLERAVGSIVASRYPGCIKVYIVFDQTEPHLPEFELPPNRSVIGLVNTRSPGLAGARNTGIMAADTALIAFCDDDDEWLRDKLRLQVEALRNERRAIVATTGIAVAFRGRVHERVAARSTITLKDLVRSRTFELHPSSVVAWRRAVLEDIGLVDEQIPGGYGEDFEWQLRAATLAPILAVRRPLVRVHWHESSWFADRWDTIIESILYLLDRHPELRTDPHGLSRLYGRMAFAHAAAGRGSQARRIAWDTIRLNWRERRGYLAVAVSLRLVSAQTLLRLAHRTGRGI